MSSPAREIAGKGAQGAIAKVGASILERLVDKSIDFVKDRRAWANLLLQYENKYLARYGIVKFLGMPQGLVLDQVYTDVRILDDASIRQFASLDASEQAYREKGIRRFQKSECRLGEDGEPDNGIEVANQYPCLMVLGGAGAGKSTFLRRIGLAAARGEAQFFEHDCIPVMLELKKFKEADVDLQSAIAQEFANVGFDFSQDFVEEALQQGKLLVLFDGLDEVPQAKRGQVIDAIQNFVSRCDKNRFIASCRLASYRSSSFPTFTDIKLADFDDDQIQQFIYNWFNTDIDQKNDTAEQCWILLNEDSQKSAKELAQTPLLLMFLCISYEKNKSFPAHRATLCSKAFDILLKEWAEEKTGQHEPVYEGLNTELEKEMLAEIAYEGFVDDQLFFTQSELLNQIKQFLADSVDKPKYLDSRKVLDEIAAQQGILVEHAEDFYTFSHLTFHEYLVAQHISQDYESILCQHLTEPRWREVLLLVPALLPKADRMLQLMHQTAEQEINSPALQALLTWAEQVTVDAESASPPCVRRSIALSLSLDFDHGLGLAPFRAQFLAFSLNHSYLTLNRAFVVLTRHATTRINNRRIREFDLAFCLTSACVSARSLAPMFNSSVNFNPIIEELESLHSQQQDNQVSQEQLQAFLKRLPQLWSEVLNLDSALLNLSKPECQSLKNYLYINELMVRCKQAAVRVSRNVWEEIESQMLLPPKT